MTRQKNYWVEGVALVLIVLVAYSYYIEVKSYKIERTPITTESMLNEKNMIVFTDVRLQAPEFLSYYDSITLSPEQEKIKNEVLSAMSAPCCVDPLSTCCCPCNLAKTVWGLSNFLIVKHGYNAEQLEDAIYRWLSFTNKNGYTGVACYEGRCEFPFEQDGCGGMRNLVLGTET